MNTKWAAMAGVAALAWSFGARAGEGGAGQRYATTPFMEPDRCSVAWVIKRQLDEGARFEFHKRDALPEDVVLFDLPESDIKRDARRSAVEVLIDRHGLQSPFLNGLTRLVHDVEINAWSSRRTTQSLTFEQIMVDALTVQDDPARALELCFGLLDTLRDLDGDVARWALLWRDEEGAIRGSVPAMYHLDWRGLDNLIRVSERIYSGAEPTADQGFQSLRRLGVEVLISVDGALPDVDAARRHGLRYVHLPMGYDGATPDLAAALRRVSRETDSRIYVHCHHGRHRGPVAAALLLKLDEDVPSEVLLELLTLAQTNTGYEGLWRTVREFDPSALDDRNPPLRERVEVPSFTARMAALDRIWDRVKLGRLSGWDTAADHPDVSPTHEALMLWEGLTEARRMESRPSSPDFDAMLDEAIAEADALRRALTTRDAKAADAAYSALGTRCGRCHEAYRNR